MNEINSLGATNVLRHSVRNLAVARAAIGFQWFSCLSDFDKQQRFLPFFYRDCHSGIRQFSGLSTWFVVTSTSPKYQPLRPHSYGRFRGFAGILSNTCAGLWGMTTERADT